ncbi:MAG TPA: peptidoglycan DD-metalloendopeptidase family protein [Candidatus Methylomirabilis sp.]|nr:peptidoglycan DD-metalloendopeptidase family protein [Candidatus Methylomirabilis sp.]
MGVPSEPGWRVAGLPAGLIWGTALGLLAILPLSGHAQAAEQKRPRTQESRERLKEVQRELGRERRRAREAVQKEASLSKELGRLDEDLRAKTKRLRELEATLKESSQRITKLSRDIGVTEARLNRSRGLLRRRLRAIYKQGRFGYVRMLLSADDFSSAGRRLKYLSAVAAQDQRLMQSYSSTLTDLSQKRGELEQHKAQVAEATEKAAATRGQIVEEQRKRRILLASVREEKAGHLASIKELEHSAKDLQALIGRLQSEEERQRRAGRTPSRRESSRGETPGGRVKEELPDIPDDGRFAQLKGRLPWPAVGPLASTFGRQEHPRFHTVTFNRGIEIEAPEGKNFVAVADGVVIYADWFKGYGRLLILDHGGGYFTLYAHAAEFLARAGESVSRGQAIGRVGDSGSLEGPQLYFELRHKGKPQDPVAWLQPR